MLWLLGRLQNKQGSCVSLYEANKYIPYMYNEEICLRNDGFSHITLNTLALHYSGVNLK